MRILVVEDEPDLLRSIAQALREEGYAVDTAGNGADGLFSAENSDYDALVLDVMMPAANWTDWEMLCTPPQGKKTPVLMLTARDQSRDRVRRMLDTAGRMITLVKTVRFAGVIRAVARLDPPQRGADAERD